MRENHFRDKGLEDRTEYKCRCGGKLEVPEEFLGELERGDEIILRCRNESCCYLAVIQKEKIIEYVPPRQTARWTETHY